MLELKQSNTTTPDYWEDACHSLSVRDTKLGSIIENFQNDSLSRNPDAFIVLLRSINGQQISVKAADAIWQRIETLIFPLTPEELLKTSHETLRAIGLSRQKAMYYHHAADCFIQFPELMCMHWKDYERMAERLIEIKGVGQWTIKMVGIFHLNHPDIFPVSDIGLLRAMRRCYGEDFDAKSAEEFGTQWKPYRTVATWYLWRSLDPQSVQY